MVKGIDQMTVAELKAALKKRRMKGYTKMNKEQLADMLKKEVRNQRTLGRERKEKGWETRGKVLEERYVTEKVKEGSWEVRMEKKWTLWLKKL